MIYIIENNISTDDLLDTRSCEMQRLPQEPALLQDGGANETVPNREGN